MSATASPSGMAITGARIFDGFSWHNDKALLIDDNARVTGIVARSDAPDSTHRHILHGGILVPGFVDLQVNGGGGVLLNDEPTLSGLTTICTAHRQFGTTSLLPTLITDTPDITARTIAAGRQAHATMLSGFLGLHLEGPHLAPARKGAHDPTLIRPIEDDDIQRLTDAVAAMPVLLTTLAPDIVAPARIRKLTAAGVIVSLGHSNASADQVEDAVAAGATMVTHLFNAMSPLGHREPGMVGAALDQPCLHCGLIADGIHVDARVISLALRAKNGAGRLFLVTDAMAATGTDLTSFTLNGRTIHRRDGRLTLADGTLAGADIDMIASVRLMHRTVGLPLDEALRMASLYPAQAVGQTAIGHLQPGAQADFVHLSPDLTVREVWIRSKSVFAATA